MSNPANPRGPYAKTAAVKQRILESAMEAFAESGFRATTMKEISERAGISQRGLVHHYVSKDEILTAVLARHDQEVALLVPNARGLDTFTGMIEVIETTGSKPGIIELYTTLATEALTPEHPAHEHYKNRFQNFRLYIEQAFAALQQEGRIDSQLDCHTLAAAFTSLLEGLQVQWLYDRESINIAETLRVFLSAVITDYPNQTRAD